MNATVDPLIVTGGSDAQPLSADTIAVMSPYRVTRQMRGGGYVTTVVDQDAQIGGDIPTRFLLSESEELVASDGHHITLHPGAISGVTTSGRIVDGVMLSGRKVRDEYPSHWLNSQQWLRFRAEAMDRGEAVFEGIRRLRVRCGSTAVNNDRPIFFQRRGFGGGAFFAREAFVEAQLADDYLLLDDGIPVERYTAEFYKKRPFIGVRPERIRPGEVFDLTITVCDPESFENLLITRDDGLRTPDVRVKVNDVDITPALAEKFAGFNPFGFPSNATSPYPGFRVVWPQMKIDEEMPLKIAVEVRDALGNVNQTVSQYSITDDPLLFDFFKFPLGLYAVPQAGLQKAKDNGFNLVLPDNYTQLSATGSARWGLTPMLRDWLDAAKALRLRTLVGVAANLCCPSCDWSSKIDTVLGNSDPDKMDIVTLPDEPVPIDTLWTDVPAGFWGCEGPADNPTREMACYPHTPAGINAWRDPIRAEDYTERQFPDRDNTSPQVFFDAPAGRFPDPEWDCRLKNTCDYVRVRIARRGLPLHINLFTQLGEGCDKNSNRVDIWKRFMPFVDYFSIDYYPTKFRDPLAWVAQMMDEMHEARDSLNLGGAAGSPVAVPVQRVGQSPALPQAIPALKPELWFVLDFGDGWGWDPKKGQWGSFGDYPGCPTDREYECMTYLALTHGAKGLLYFAYPDHSDAWPNYRPPTTDPAPSDREPHPLFDERIWATAARINNELKQLSPILHYADADKSVVIIDHPKIVPPGPRGPVEQIGKLVEPVSVTPAAKPGSQRASEPVLALGTDHDVIGPGAIGPGSVRSGVALSLGEPFTYHIHCLGKKADISNPLEVFVYPKAGYLYYYLIAVNGVDSNLTVRFTCKWLPGYDPSTRTIQVGVPPVKVMFEDRDILLQVSEEQAIRWPATEEVFFLDDFEPHQRHVYMIPREDFRYRQLPLVYPVGWGVPYGARLIVSAQV